MRRLLATLLLLVVPAAARGAELRVSAAASLSDVMTAIGRRYEAAGGAHVVFNFAGSSTLARQIEEGAPADVFVSADEAQMDRLSQQHLVDAATRRDVTANRLVIVAATGVRLRAPRELLRVRTLALAEPGSVPAGVYAKQYLTSLGLWTRIASKVVPTENVRAALAAVDAGNADAAIVYATDAAMAKHARVVYAVGRGEGPRIVYPAAVVAASRAGASGARFVAFLVSAEGRSIFKEFGFMNVE